ARPGDGGRPRREDSGSGRSGAGVGIVRTLPGLAGRCRPRARGGRGRRPRPLVGRVAAQGFRRGLALRRLAPTRATASAVSATVRAVAAAVAAVVAVATVATVAPVVARVGRARPAVATLRAFRIERRARN